MKEALSSSETSVLTRATGRHSPEDGILHSHRRENLKSDIALNGWALGPCLLWGMNWVIQEDGIPHSHRRENLKY
jgi:hypothetical protein